MDAMHQAQMILADVVKSEDKMAAALAATIVAAMMMEAGEMEAADFLLTGIDAIL